MTCIVRLSLAAAGCLASVSVPACAFDTSTPAALTRDIYARYGRDGAGLALRGADGEQVFAPGLLALVKADAARAQGETGALDFDPFCGCQDFAIDRVALSVTSADPAISKVRVTFRNFGRRASATQSMTRTVGGWRIADIRTSSMPSLTTFLRDASRN